MAIKLVETVWCDACAKKDLDVGGTVILTVMEVRFDLCDEHGERFRDQLVAALGPSAEAALSA